MTKTQKPSTADKLLNTAQALILQDGFRAVSVDRIIEATGVSKGTFFYHFASKEALAIRLFERFIGERGEAMRTELAKINASIDDPLERVLLFTSALGDIFQNNNTKPGCLIGSFSYQLVEEIPELKSTVERSLNGWKNLLIPVFEAVDHAYKKRDATVQPEQLALHLFTLIQGGMILSRISCDWKVLHAQLNEFKRYLTLLYR